MCYLPLPLLKLFVGIGAAISALLSVAILAAVIYVNFEHKDIIDNANQPVIKTLFVFVYIISIVFLILALCGLFGSIKAKRKNKLAPCLLSAYLVSVVFFFAIFLAITIILFAAPPAVFGQSCKQGSSTKLVEDIAKISDQANTNFCTDACPCYLNNTNMNSNLSDWLSTHNRKNFTNVTQSGNINYRSCLKNVADQANGILLGSLEDFLDCGGWCADDSIPKFLRFSDINLCTSSDCYTKKEACYDKFKDFMVSKGKIMGIATGVMTAIVLLNVIFVFCICCHPHTKAQKNKNFYARMMDQS